MKKYTDSDLLAILKSKVGYLTQKEVAVALGFTPQFINDVLAERRPITNKLADTLGFTRMETLYTRKAARDGGK